MNTIGGWGFAASGILVLVAVGISLWQTLELEKSLLWASTRALVQLAVMGVVLGVLLDESAPVWWSWVWVIAMVTFATRTLVARAYGSDQEVHPASLRGLVLTSTVAFGAATGSTLGVLFGFGVFEVEPRTIVPLSGMIIGNSMNAAVLATRRVTAEFSERSDEVEARLALGSSSQEAAKPYLREAIRTALIPQIETTKAVGVIFLPGAMVGLILAGVDISDAIRVQLAVMYLILGSVSITTAVIALGLSRQFFTPDHRLIRPKRQA